MQIGVEGELNFPVNYDILITMTVSDRAEDDRAEIENVLDKHGISHDNWRARKSETARYVRYAVNITVNDREAMYALYADLKTHPAVKIVL